MNTCFPIKVVTRHTFDKSWVTSYFLCHYRFVRFPVADVFANYRGVSAIISLLTRANSCDIVRIQFIIRRGI